MSYRNTKYTPVLFGTPMLSISEGGTVTPDMAAMSSQLRRDMLVDEIQFSCASPPKASTVWPSMASSLRCRLTLGRSVITSTRDGGNFVPIWSFGPPLQNNTWCERDFDQWFSSSTITTGHFRWKLPKPLYVPAGQTLMASFSRQRDGIGGTAMVSMTVMGRQIGDVANTGNRTSDVPFVAFYEPTFGQETAISSELDIVNPLSVPINVQRFIGRQLNLTAPTVPTENNLTMDTVIANVQIKSSTGYDIVRNPTDFGIVFDTARRGWTFMRILNPRERYIIQLSNVVTGFQPQISIIGWRPEGVS